MRQILAMQMRQMLDGRRKWFVAIFLLLPVLLTWLNMNLGGLGAVRRDQLAATSGGPPSAISATARRVVSTGDVIELVDGQIRVYPDRIMWGESNIVGNYQLIIDDGYIVVDHGKVWIDESRRSRNGHSFRVREPGQNIPWETLSSIYLFLLYPQVICLLLALFYGSSLLGSELDNKTLTYLFTRPVARWRVVVGKYTAVVAVLIPPSAVSLATSWWIMGMPGGTVLFAAILTAATLAVVTYNAVFALLGFLVPRRAIVFALVYAVVFEFLLALVPAVVNTFTVTYYLRSIVVEMLNLEVPAEISRIVGGASLPASLLALAGMVVVGLTGASLLASRREYAVTDQP